MAILRSMINQIRSDNSYPGTQSKKNKSNENKEIIRRLRIQNKKQLEQLNLVKGKFKHLKSENSNLMIDFRQVSKYNNLLAAALGSCAVCWGEDRDCIYCFGKGSAGWRMKNKKLFKRYVFPGLEPVQLKRKKEIK